MVKGLGGFLRGFQVQVPMGTKIYLSGKKKRSFRGERYVEQYLVVQVSLL